MRYFLFNVLLAWVLSAEFFFASLFAASDRKRIRIAAREASPYINEIGEERGYFYEIVTRAFELAGYKFEVEFYPPIRARKVVETGENDVLIPSTDKHMHSETLVYSSPLNGSTIGYIKFKDSPQIFEGPSREIPSFVSSPEQAKKDSWRWNNGDSEKMIQKIDMLNQKRVPYIIADKLTAAHVIASERPHLVGKLEFVHPPIAHVDFHVAFSKKNPRYRSILKDFNRAVAQMKKSGEYQKILLRYGVLDTADDDKSLVIGTVANSDMKILESLSPHFLAKHPGVSIRWNTIDENLLRKRIFSSIAMNENAFDIINIGQNETRVYARKGWISPLETPSAEYEVSDLIPTLRSNLSHEGKLFALPFYSESSMTYYRSDLFAKKNLRMPDKPSYQEIKDLAAQVHDPKAGVYGICLRGKAGWGENSATITSTVKAFGGQWFAENWQPTLNTPAWFTAVTYYMDLVKTYGPPDAYRNGYVESLELFAKGQCAIWIDATVAASYLSDPKHSKVAGHVAFAAAPQESKGQTSNWKWTWAFAISSTSQKKKLAQSFMEWATSKEYIQLVAKHHGWKMVPPGTRISTYKNPRYIETAPFAPFVFDVLNVPAETKSNPRNNAQLVELDVAEFPALGNTFGNYMSDVLKNKRSIKEALLLSQRDVKRIMYHSGYYR